MNGGKDATGRESERQAPPPLPHPIEPQGAGSGWLVYLRWVFLFVALLYVLGIAFHAPLLRGIGRYLVVEHTPTESDMIVCLAGGNVERGLATADLYSHGLATRISLALEEPPDGLDQARERGADYPESIELLVGFLLDLGVPRSAILVGESPVGSTLEEARALKDLVNREKVSSLILVTSPTHTRRVWLTFRKVFEGENIRIQVVPSPYSRFTPEDWWKSRRAVREVIVEYQKLVFYLLKELR